MNWAVAGQWIIDRRIRYDTGACEPAARRWRAISYNTIELAQATLSDEAAPPSGMRTTASLSS
jgi:hypothetical protein